MLRVDETILIGSYFHPTWVGGFHEMHFSFSLGMRNRSVYCRKRVVKCLKVKLFLRSNRGDNDDGGTNTIEPRAIQLKR